MSRFPVAASLMAVLLLSGCDMLGIESPEKLAAARDADGRAIGAACRHAGRAIEDCYALNRRSERAAMFAGWRDMNDYMRENDIAPLPPQLTPQVTRADARADAPGAGVSAIGAPRKPGHARNATPDKDAKAQGS